MEIFVCIAVSAATSIIAVKFFAYKYFDVIDKHMKELLDDTKKLFDSAINMMRDTTGSE